MSLSQVYQQEMEFIVDIAIHPNNPDIIMVVFSNYSTYSLFYSEDKILVGIK